jgi:deoxyribodipyrimidine photo-lyase
VIWAGTVRRELAHNFVHFTEDYDLYTCLPGWARATLDEHCDDERPQLYTKAQLDTAETRDPYWNAALGEMKHTGYMHNHMRIYWGKGHEDPRVESDAGAGRLHQ